MDVEGRSVVDVLIDDHRRIAGLLARLVTRRRDRRQVADELIGTLLRHIFAEDLYLYPVIGEVIPGRSVDLTYHLGIDARVEQILTELTEADPAGNLFDELITRLVTEGRQAVLHEELDALPRLARYGDPRTLAVLGDMVTAFKDAAVIEKTCGGRLAVRFGDRVIHR